MNAEVPKPAPKGALRRLGQRLEQLFPPLMSDEEVQEFLETSRQRMTGGLDSELNSPLDIITIFINNMVNFNYADADKARAEEERIKNEKKSQTSPEPPPHPLGKLIQTFNEIKETLYHR